MQTALLGIVCQASPSRQDALDLGFVLARRQRERISSKRSIQEKGEKATVFKLRCVDQSCVT